LRHGDGRLRFYGIQQFWSGDEHDAGAGSRKQPSAKARILLEVMLAALDRAESDRVSDHPRLEAGLDPEESSDLLQHRHR
jgi:hypothetical protein